MNDGYNSLFLYFTLHLIGQFSFFIHFVLNYNIIKNFNSTIGVKRAEVTLIIFYLTNHSKI